MELQPYDFRDPEALITEIAERVPLRAGDVYLALVAHPSTEQRIDQLVLLGLDAVQERYQPLSEEIRHVMDSLSFPEARPRRTGP
ncbi:hypothetical protein [Nocardioides sp.]|uniref:hypothetical protein n=1 Tax=Nocardioides sp. TaxID=35761 RepID=UPI0027222AC5|nr:hypothetical protein [Nocardioides sp.]MDO9457253.1 hypothetical protein [Nocardioides sp.]